MMSKKQLKDAATCRGIDCTLCLGRHLNQDGECGECTEKAAKTALAYRNMLKRLEWRARVDGIRMCPMCYGEALKGHKSDCRLAAILKGDEKE